MSKPEFRVFSSKLQSRGQIEYSAVITDFSLKGSTELVDSCGEGVFWGDIIKISVSDLYYKNSSLENRYTLTQLLERYNVRAVGNIYENIELLFYGNDI